MFVVFELYDDSYYYFKEVKKVGKVGPNKFPLGRELNQNRAHVFSVKHYFNIDKELQKQFNKARI